ncbi:MAG: DUF1836 domain-containing protein [Oscillospiraceae bacterium]|jgi:DNA-binding transcriptional MerR regulator|nr:DUF1836 domain-containing protein [Oscillospiraceae bacterium]
MGETKEKLLPGTSTTYFGHGEKGFSKIEMLLSATGGLNLSQVCAVTGLEGTTIQNWVKRGWVANPRGKKYDEVHIARILIINALKDCIKLENIAQLMGYVNGSTEDRNDDIIKESELYNYLCDALDMLGQADDLSRSGVEKVVEALVRDYNGPTPAARDKINKALTVMIYACVCTNVKRRTEAMLGKILHGQESEPTEPTEPAEPAEQMEPTERIKPTERTASVAVSSATSGQEAPRAVVDSGAPRKTVSQALREWDRKDEENPSLEDAGEEEPAESEETPEQNDGESDSNNVVLPEIPEKTFTRPVYFRKR